MILSLCIFSQNKKPNEFIWFNVYSVITGVYCVMQRRSGGCEKQGFEYREGNGGLEDTVLENEDYIYTNSLP